MAGIDAVIVTLTRVWLPPDGPRPATKSSVSPALNCRTNWNGAAAGIGMPFEVRTPRLFVNKVDDELPVVSVIQTGFVALSVGRKSPCTKYDPAAGAVQRNTPALPELSGLNTTVNGGTL